MRKASFVRPQPVPFMGLSVARSRILNVVQRCSPLLILCIAPAGYGKTHLAAQIAALPQFDDTLWVDCQGEPLTPEGLLTSVMQQLNALMTHPEGQDTLSPDGWSAEDALAQVAAIMKERPPERSLCLVLDDLVLDLAGDGVSRLMEEMYRTASATTIVMTCREIKPGALNHVHDFLSIGREDLVLDRREGEAILRAAGVESPEDALIDTLLTSSGGQAAIFAVLLRHYLLDRNAGIEEMGQTDDIREQLRTIATSQLNQAEMTVLVAVCVLGHATRFELLSIDESFEVVELSQLAALIPLLATSASTDMPANDLFAHGIAQNVYGTREFAGAVGIRFDTLFKSCVRVLEQRADFGRALRVIVRYGETEYLADWLETYGNDAASHGLGAPLRVALESLNPSLLLRKPRLLVLLAGLLSDLGEGVEAIAKAAVARDLAKCEGDFATVADSLIKMAEIELDLGNISSACSSLNELLNLPGNVVTDAQRLVTMSYLAAFLSVLLEQKQVAAIMAELRGGLERLTMTTYQRSRIHAQLALTETMFGWFNLGVDDLQLGRRARGLPIALQVMLHGNMATLHMEAGKLSLAEEACEWALERAGSSALRIYQACFTSALGTIRFSQGDEHSGIVLMNDAIRAVRVMEDPISEAFCRSYLAVVLRAAGRVDESVNEIERTLELAKTLKLPYFEALAEVELSAGLLALGDPEASERHAARVREECLEHNAMTHLMRSDMILAEIARREGRYEEAHNRLLDHSDYIFSENANWSIAMYIRAFPHLLALFVIALGLDRLPIHMLRMITGDHIDESLKAASELLSPEDLEALAVRMLGDEGIDRIAKLVGIPPCRVRFFGGMDVFVGTRRVIDRDWDKGKGRVIFAMLILQQGREVPRDRICEYLWPGMDEPRVSNNFYVAWSAIKTALLPGSDKSSPQPYFHHKRGVCKSIAEHIDADTTQFDVLLSSARQSERMGDSLAAVRDYERVADLYRGDLLPGYLYEDWFDSARTHYQQEFCDAMLAAHRLLAQMGDHPAALRMVKRAIAADSWREDLYQAALRSHIASGQRSSAIQTYLSCRKNLAEQLGLDPSRETVRLYEQVLAMEERSDPDAPE